MIITLDQLPAELRRTAALMADGGAKAMQRAAQASRLIVQNTINATRPYAPVDTGQYRRSFFVQNVWDGADLYNPTLYAPVIEYGSEPHWVPLEPLLAWARRKSRGLKFDSHTNLRTGRTVRARGQQLKDLREQAAQALAIRAQRSIAAHGTEGRRIMQRSEPDMIAVAGRILDDMLHDLARA